MPVTFIDASGAQVEVTLDVSVYKEAAAKGLTVPQLLNQRYQTKVDAGPAFEQLCRSTGLVQSYNREFGFRPPTLGAVLDGRAGLSAASVLEGTPASRILYPAAVLELIESAMQVDRTTDPSAFDEMVGKDSYVSVNRLEYPIVNMSGAEAGVMRPISQLAKPDHMMTITTSDTSKSLGKLSLALLVSDEALNAITIDFVSDCVRRQAEVARNTQVYTWLLEFLNGDTDMGTSALSQTTAASYDSAVVAAGTITKKAYIKWLIHNWSIRQITHVVGTVDNLLTLWDLFPTTNTGIQPTGLDGLFPMIRIMNRALSDVRYFAVDATSGASWTANTLMGLDKKWAIHRITNTAAAYSAIEDYVLRRGKELRFDQSVIATRYWDNAFDVLSLTV